MIELLAIAVGAVLAVIGLRAVAPPPVRGGPPGSVAARVEQLERAERATELISMASDVHALLRPALREVAAERLRARGVELDGPSSAARRALGEALWELVRPDRPPPDRHSRGLTAAQRDALLDRLETL